MTTNWLSEQDAALSRALDGWGVQPASPWLAGRVANRILAGHTSVRLLPGRVRTRMAALALAIAVGWGIGMTVDAPEAAADGLELADLLF